MLNVPFVPTDPAYRWPEKDPAAYLDFAIDITAYLASDPAAGFAGDTLAGFAVSVRPSGPGEMTPLAPSTIGNLLVVWLSGGVSGRFHIVQFVATFGSGRVQAFEVGIAISPLLAQFPLPPPASTGPCVPVSWEAGTP